MSILGCLLQHYFKVHHISLQRSEMPCLLNYRIPFCAGSKHSYQIRRGVINATGLLMYLEARTKARSIPHLEADRKLVYIHHLSDASLLALTQASNAAPQRVNLNSYRPCLTLDHTGGAHKSTEPKSGSLS